jgi:hypothetical protein
LKGGRELAARRRPGYHGTGHQGPKGTAWPGSTPTLGRRTSAAAQRLRPACVSSQPGGVEGWLRRTGQKPNPEGLLPVTFVVDEQALLRVADRRSEHVACAGGRPVLSVGEVFVRLSAAGVAVEGASNQSTGYCPEPDSWPAVAAALDRLGIPHSGRLTQEVVFRRCPGCGQGKVVKDGWFACGVCRADLPRHWNFEEGWKLRPTSAPSKGRQADAPGGGGCAAGRGGR